MDILFESAPTKDQRNNTPHNLGHEEFFPARQHFAKLIAELCSSDSFREQHGTIESKIHLAGMEILRLLIQGHLDLRAKLEPRADSVSNQDGVELTRCRGNCTRNLETRFGEVIVTRKGYYLPSHNMVFPLDAELNLPPSKYSHGLREIVAMEAAKSSFDEVVETIDKMTGGQVPKRQTEELTALISVDFDSFYENRKNIEPEDTDDILVMSSDGKGIVMHEVDLREGTRRAAQRQREEGSKPSRLQPGEKPNRKRMSTVAAIYSIEQNIRTPEEIMSKKNKEQPKEAQKSRPRPQNKRVFASVEKEQEVVLGEMFAEAVRRDPEQRRIWALLLDGAETQLDLARNIIDQCFFSVVIILDFIHVLEYVWRAAAGLFGSGTTEAEKWVEEQALKILQGHASKVAAAMKQRATKLGVTGRAREAVDKCANYLLKYKEYLQYNKYLAAGLPIATGVIEGACRYLVKDRMELTGARWRLRDAEAVLKLRALRASGDFDDYWKFHKEEEQKRNYHSYSDDYETVREAI